MASKAELQKIAEEARRSIEEFKTDARSARGNMGGMLTNLGVGMQKLQEALQGLIETMTELDDAGRTDEESDGQHTSLQ